MLWNGPVGVFEFDQFGEGTRTLANAIARSKAFSLAGGGDTLAAIEKYGIEDSISYISTGGGAFLEFVEGKKLPAGRHPRAARGMSFIQRRTKIVATLGPATDDPKVLADMVRAGVDVVRLNFSHGDTRRSRAAPGTRAARPPSWRAAMWACSATCRARRSASIGSRRARWIWPTAPNLRSMRTLPVDAGTEHSVGIAYKKLPSDVFRPATCCCSTTAQISLQVLDVSRSAHQDRVLVGGELGNNKGINRQGGGLSAGALTDKDREDIQNRGAAQGRLSGGVLSARCRRHERGAQRCCAPPAATRC